MTNKKGFTLAELLIVVAIISVLTGISIPVFTSQLEKSRESKDLAAVRSVYAEVMLSAMMEDTEPENGVIYSNGRWYKDVSLSQEILDWQTPGVLTVGSTKSQGDNKHWVGKPAPNGVCLISYTDNPDIGLVIAWEYNFAEIMNLQVKSYGNKTVAQLLKNGSFSMFESSGSAGRDLTGSIKDQLGIKDADNFTYKVLRDTSKQYGNGDIYIMYVSEDRGLQKSVSGKKNVPVYGEIDVIGYIYEIKEDGTSTLLKQGTKQTLKTYINSNYQEKIDVNGNQDNNPNIINKANNPKYDWDM